MTPLMPLFLFLLLVFSRLVHAQPATNQPGSTAEVKTDDGAMIHCWTSGPKDSALSPILFVPGYLMPGDIFEFQMRHFEGKRRVVAMDPRSQGQSSRVTFGHYPARRAKDIKAVIEALALKDVVVVGWSLAAMEVLSLCDQFSLPAVKGIVLVDGDLSYEVSKEESAGEMAFLKRSAGLFQASRMPALKAFVERMYSKPVDKGHLERIVKAVQDTSEDTGLALLVGRLGFRVRLGEIQTPALVVISGKNSRRETIATKAKELKRGEVHVFEEAGHALFVDEAEKFNSLLEEFVARLEAKP
jgi:non-heme chloroperoxidase